MSSDRAALSTTAKVGARLAAGAAAVVVIVALLLASSVPNLVFAPNVVIDTVIRKIGHFVAFLVLSFLICSARPGWLSARHAAQLAVVIAIVTAVGDELGQLHVAGRIASPIDAGIDIGGALTGAFIFTRTHPDDGRESGAGDDG